MKTIVTAIALISVPAFADDPAPASPAAPAEAAAPTEAPQTPADAPSTPAEAPPSAPAEAHAEAPPTPASAPTPTPALSSTIADAGALDDEASVAPAPPRVPTFALELSGTGSYTANPYVEYRGWTLETGANKGMRLEANLIGIQLAYEVSTLANERACSIELCVMGELGSTTAHAFELGYRFRFANVGPLRPFVTASLGGVLANSGDWSMTTNKLVKGGAGRAGFGIEYPIAGRFFASATLAYRIVITENPLRDAEGEKVDAVLVGGGDPPNGDYAEDLHLVSGYVGFGVSL